MGMRDVVMTVWVAVVLPDGQQGAWMGMSMMAVVVRVPVVVLQGQVRMGVLVILAKQQDGARSDHAQRAKRKAPLAGCGQRKQNSTQCHQADGSPDA